MVYKFDPHNNLSVSPVTAQPNPQASGTTLGVQSPSRFPAPGSVGAFNIVVCDPNNDPDPSFAEILRVTGGTGSSGAPWTVLRAQEGSSARTIANGDKVFLGITKKVLEDIEYFAQSVNVQHYTTTSKGSVWVNPLSAAKLTSPWFSAALVHVQILAQGGGGGAGATGATSTIRGGGGGGSSGQALDRMFNSDTFSIYVGNAASIGLSGATNQLNLGGAASAASNTTGNAGQDGAPFSFGILLKALGGRGGAGGTASGGGAAGVAPFPGYSNSGGSGGGLSAAAGNNAPVPGFNVRGGGGGGGGAGITSGNAFGAGGSGGYPSLANVTSGFAGGAAGSASSPGTNAGPMSNPYIQYADGYGSAGGGSGAFGGGNGGHNSSGVANGAGGGGGGASLNGGTSGAGGYPGVGVITVSTIFS